jgi:hypothetical protein
LTAFRTWLRRMEGWKVGRPRWLPDAMLRLSLALGLLLAAGFVARYLAPPSLKQHDLQIAAAAEREAAREPVYAGAPVCLDCHADQVTAKAQGYHRNVSCETCHGPVTTHLENPVEVKPPAPRDRRFCPTCHAYSLSRPMGFPQVNPVTHNPLQPCISCHEPHDPKPPTVPGECTACHANIERTKALSPHVLLQCTTCHDTPEEHKVTPRVVRPTKPTSREFCGTCHGSESTVAGVPRVDLRTHGTKYLCWQCHYPHMPEVH